MDTTIVTLFPDLYRPFFETSLMQRAQRNNFISSRVLSLYDYAAPKERIDGPSFGPGPGMVIRPEVVERAMDEQICRDGKPYTIFFSPHGERLTQPRVASLYQNIMQAGGRCCLLPARYEGMDARIEDAYADAVVSIGDYVLMGGDVPALAFLEAITRYIPGVVGNEASVEEDSFSGALVDHPHYTAPLVWRDKKVPGVIRSGDHGKIEAWREQQAMQRTLRRHYGWFRSHPQAREYLKLARTECPSHYLACSDGAASIRPGGLRSMATTYGLSGAYSVGDGHACAGRFGSFEAVWREVASREGVAPVVVGICNVPIAGASFITYAEQEKVWAHRRPVLLCVLGDDSSRGCECVCDYRLSRPRGMTDVVDIPADYMPFLVVDRWLGLYV